MAVVDAGVENGDRVSGAGVIGKLLAKGGEAGGLGGGAVRGRVPDGVGRDVGAVEGDDVGGEPGGWNDAVL